MPPTAASTGVATRRRSRSSPMSNSRRISSPTTKKKNAIKPVVDPVAQVERQLGVAELQRHLGVPERLVAGRPRRVGPRPARPGWPASRTTALAFSVATNSRTGARRRDQGVTDGPSAASPSSVSTRSSSTDIELPSSSLGAGAYKRTGALRPAAHRRTQTVHQADPRRGRLPRPDGGPWTAPRTGGRRPQAAGGAGGAMATGSPMPVSSSTRCRRSLAAVVSSIANGRAVAVDGEERHEVLGLDPPLDLAHHVGRHGGLVLRRLAGRRVDLDGFGRRRQPRGQHHQAPPAQAVGVGQLGHECVRLLVEGRSP